MGSAKKVKVTNQGPGGFIFFLTYIGAVVYFVQQNEGFWGFVLALLQGIVWPAYLVYHVFELLQV